MAGGPMSDSEPVIVITLRLSQTVVMNRGIPDVMRSTVLMPDGKMILDYEGYGAGGFHTGDVVGEWVIEP